jgi:hypothetical protein
MKLFGLPRLHKIPQWKTRKIQFGREIEKSSPRLGFDQRHGGVDKSVLDLKLHGFDVPAGFQQQAHALHADVGALGIKRL